MIGRGIGRAAKQVIGGIGLLGALSGCADREEAAIRAFSRASLDLRGVRPSLDEIERLQNRPADLDAMLDGLPDDPRFGWNVALQHEPSWSTRVEAQDLTRVDYGIANESGYMRDTGEEPLRILAWIADHDLPWTDVVTAEWTVVTPQLAADWPVSYVDPEQASTETNAWHQARYTDGRAMAGVLSSSGFWWRYNSTYTNANRGRANAVSRILLCNNYLEREIAFNPELDLTDEEAVLHAIRNDTGCLGCHATLDPLGAFFWGYYHELNNNIHDWAYYHPNREDYWEPFLVAPAYYGTPGEDMADLGRAIAADPRLIECVVRRSREALLQRPTDPADLDTLTRHRENFLAGGITLRALYRSLLADPAYRAVDDTGPWKVMSPDRFASALADLTGWSFQAEGHDVLAEDWFGLRSQAGGGRSLTGQAPEPTTTGVEVQENLALTAASFAARRDAVDPDHAQLFTRIDFTMTPDTQERLMREQIRDLHLRALGEDVALQGEEVDRLLDLWIALEAESDTVVAWTGVLAALIRDPAFVVY